MTSSLERKISRYLKARNWDHLRPADLAKSIMIEGAELLELFQWENRSLEEVKQDKEKCEAIKKELADVFIYALDLSVSLGFDTEKIIRHKLALIEKKYPAKVMRERGRKEAGTESAYWKIKRAHRGREHRD